MRSMPRRNPRSMLVMDPPPLRGGGIASSRNLIIPRTIITGPADFELFEGETIRARFEAYGAGGPGAGGGYNTGGYAGGGGGCAVCEAILTGPGIIGFQPARGKIGGAYGETGDASNPAWSNVYWWTPSSGLLLFCRAQSGFAAISSSGGQTTYSGSGGSGEKSNAPISYPQINILSSVAYTGSSGVNFAAGKAAGPEGNSPSYISPGPGYKSDMGSIGQGGFGDSTFNSGSGSTSAGGDGLPGGIVWWTIQ